MYNLATHHRCFVSGYIYTYLFLVLNTRLGTVEFIKAVSDAVVDMTNAVFHEKPLIFIKAVLFITLYLT